MHSPIHLFSIEAEEELLCPATHFLLRDLHSRGSWDRCYDWDIFLESVCRLRLGRAFLDGTYSHVVLPPPQLGLLPLHLVVQIDPSWWASSGEGPARAPLPLPSPPSPSTTNSGAGERASRGSFATPRPRPCCLPPIVGSAVVGIAVGRRVGVAVLDGLQTKRGQLENRARANKRSFPTRATSRSRTSHALNHSAAW